MSMTTVEFDCKVAAIYDLFTRIGFLKKIYDNVALDILKDNNWFTLMDIGGGTGPVEERIVKKRRAGIIFLVEMSHCMIERARRKKTLKKHDNPKILFVNMDAGKMVFLKEKVDLAFALFSYHHWPDRIETFRGILNTLKKGGRLWIFEINTGLSPEKASKYYRTLGVPSSIGEKVHRMIIKSNHGSSKKELLSLVKELDKNITVSEVLENWRELPIIKIEYRKT